MKNLLLCVVGVFLIGCFSSSQLMTKSVISDPVQAFGTELRQIQGSIQAVSLVAAAQAAELGILERVQKPIRNTFGCTPDKPKPPEPAPKPVPTPVPAEPVKPQIMPPKPVQTVQKPLILGVRGEVASGQGRIMLNKVNVKLNKVAADKVRKGGKVRIFIDYCYYEGGKISKDNTVSVDIGWHPPTKGKVGVSVFTQTGLGSGVQHCSVIMNI